MQFSVGDKIVHPHRGPGRIVDVQRREFLEGEKRYYKIEIPAFAMTLHVPARRASELGLRRAMSKTKLKRVLEILRGTPASLPKDYKERQELVWEKIRTARPIATAEAVRDLVWRRHVAHLTRKDTELLRRAEDMLSAEFALVSDTEVEEAHQRIESALTVHSTDNGD